IVRHQQRLNESPDVRTRSLNFHRRIFAAIAAGDPDAAKTAMAEHLADVQAALAERPGNR
ncbi:MAG TPA: FCD domain-containing protein, partial [Limnochordia bacterium]|nr:FCD domain-containing protein [Limnochordia bacterium]